MDQNGEVSTEFMLWLQGASGHGWTRRGKEQATARYCQYDISHHWLRKPDEPMMTMISQPRDRSDPTWENPSMSPKTAVHSLRVVWPEPSFPAQTSVFIAFTGDSPSGLEAKPKDASNQTEAKSGTRNLCQIHT